MSSESSNERITDDEVDAQLRYVERVLSAADDNERKAALADGLLAFGVRFIALWDQLVAQAADPEDFQQTAIDLRVLFVGWLKGRDLTARADERERRALAALQVLDDGPEFFDYTHYAAEAILELPESHPTRDVERVRTAVRAQLHHYQKQGDDTPWVFAAYALALAYKERLGTDEELIAWEPWVEKVASQLEPADALRLWGAVEAFYIELSERDGAQWRDRATSARSRIDSMVLSDDDQSLNDLMRLLATIADGDQLSAAERLKRAIGSGSFDPDVQRMIAVREARIRLAHDDWERVIALLESRIDGYEEEYVTSILADDRAAAGADFGEACTSLAFARAHVGQWELAVETLERGKCARQRYIRALRRTPGAAKLLELEADLYAISRGLPLDHGTESVARVQDWLAHGLSPEAQLQEQYRQLIPALDPSGWRAPRIADIQRGLQPGEAALSLGLSWPGLLAALVVSDRPTCLSAILRSDVTEATIEEDPERNEGGATS